MGKQMTKPKTIKNPGRMKFGVKAYGTEHRFATRREYLNYLQRWMCSSDGAERDRAVGAYGNLCRGIPFTDTDN